MIVSIAFVALVTAITPPFIDFPYEVDLVAPAYPSAGTVTVRWGSRTSGDRVFVASGRDFEQQIYGYDIETYFLDDQQDYDGYFSWSTYTYPNTNYTFSGGCTYGTLAANDTGLADVFDFSSKGWLASANVSVFGNTVWFQTTVERGVIAGLASRSVSSGAPATYALVADTKGNLLSFHMTASYYSYTHMFAGQPKKLNKLPDANVPSECIGDGDRCPANVTQIDIVLLRNHGNSSAYRELDNVNLADVPGEIYWLCDYRAPSPLISKFKLTVSPRWSNYMLCNQGVCTASTYGQRLGIGKQNNAYYDKCYDAPPANNTCQFGSCGAAGAWYAFPVLGRCPPGKAIGYHNCTWLDHFLTIRTITVDCLRNVSDHNFDCENTTMPDLARQLEHAFTVCDDVQYSLSTHAPVDDAVMPVLSAPVENSEVAAPTRPVHLAFPSHTPSRAMPVPRAPPR